jgi:hypothetical protein
MFVFASLWFFFHSLIPLYLLMHDKFDEISMGVPSYSMLLMHDNFTILLAYRLEMNTS